MKKVIITGANGFVGHHLVRELVDEGTMVYAIVQNEHENIDNISSLSNVRIIYCELAEINQLPNKIKEDVQESIFYHLAWAGSSRHLHTNYELQMKNATWTADAAKVAGELGCSKIVFAGSAAQLMYGDYLKQDGIIPEMVTCYAIAKNAAEHLMKCVCPSVGIVWNWAYISNIYGADDQTMNFINSLIKNYREGVTPELTPATQLADFMYVTDVARGLIAMAEKGKDNVSYYLGYGEPRALSEFVLQIHNMVNSDIPSGIGRKEFKGFSIDFDKIQYRKLNEDTGFVPRVTFNEGLEKVLKEI